ncbi:F-box/FBD/LRR protein [Rhynchospora pubera]|uniref:F-box/FBD/LRR protein n=1 Tax=Rhynchospora pubera TaxID=906938 RepID=A0AAV8EAX5_9POAL|nr:F-box/FBD/LRR protein [Rhynchospora pubera]KAJ4802435.1 F-box/FBD/LRR protein [Rhynchospora pubera]
MMMESTDTSELELMKNLPESELDLMKKLPESELDLMKKLPEKSLLHIMGLMKTRAAVQTCLLTKQWNHLWPHLSVLDFDLKEFNSGDPEQDKQTFSQFVTMMLERRKAINLHKFRLSCADLCEEQYCLSLKKWIMYAIEHQVRVLELAFCRRMLSINIFECDSVEELYLYFCDCSLSISNRFTMLNPKINLPRLRKLQLHGKCISSPNFLTNLIKGCPLLEELWFESFNVPLGSTIYSKNLQHLTFKNCREIYKLDIYAENLISLCFIGLVDDFMRICYQCRSTGFSLSLSHATVSILTDSYSHFSLNTILDDLSHVANLKLCVSKSTPDSQLLPYDRAIPNLKELSFCGYSLDYFPGIWKYLRNLEKLNLWLFCQHSHEHYEEILNWDGALQIALIECKKLKVVEIVCAILDDKTEHLVENLRQLTDVKIVISDRGF